MAFAHHTQTRQAHERKKISAPSESRKTKTSRRGLFSVSSADQEKQLVEAKDKEGRRPKKRF